MSLPAVKTKAFSGLGNLFNGYLETALNQARAGALSSAGQAAVTALTPVAVADATDAATAAALANANKAAINAIIAALKA